MSSNNNETQAAFMEAIAGLKEYANFHASSP